MNDIMTNNEDVERMQTCNINDFCRLCANVDDDMVPIYADEGADHMLESKIKTHLPFINISKNDLLPKRICYHCASAVLVWNELYESSSNADLKLRSLFEASPFDHNQCKEVSYADIDEMSVPIKHFIGNSIEYEEITDVNMFNKNEKSDKTLNELDKAPSTSKADSILNHEDKSPVIQEDERLNPSLKSDMSNIFGRVDDDDHNMYLNAAGMDDDINGLMNCHRLDMSAADDCTLVAPKEEYLDEHVECVMDVDHTDECKDDAVTSVTGDDDDHHLEGLECDQQQQPQQYHQQNPHPVLRICRLPRGQSYLADPNDMDVDLLAQASNGIGGSNSSGGHGGGGGSSCGDDEEDEEDVDNDLRSAEASTVVVGGDAAADDENENDDRKSPMLSVVPDVRLLKCEYDEEADGAVGSSTAGISSDSDQQHQHQHQHQRQRHHNLQLRRSLHRLHDADDDDDDDDDDDGSAAVDDDCGPQVNVEVRQVYISSVDNDGAGGGGDDDEEMETMCQICATVFKTRYNLLRHFQKRHPEYKMYECDLCRISFPTITEFKQHLEQKHSKVHQPHAVDSKQVRFACDVCGNMYKNKASAMNHLLTHTAKKTVRCPHCDFTCYTKQQLGVHQTKHDKRFVCEICHKRFAQKSQLDVHVNAVHYNQRPFACVLCNKSFKTKGSHDAHMIVHTDTRNYQCPHCDKKCRKRYDLTLHIRTHTGEKPFKCSVCGRGFVQMCDTRKHEMLHFKPGKRKNVFFPSAEAAGGALDDE